MTGVQTCALPISPDALVLADARPPALLAFAPPALVLADARAPALLALTPLALVRADTVLLLLLCCVCSRFVCLLASPALADAAVADARCLVSRQPLPIGLIALGRLILLPLPVLF